MKPQTITLTHLPGILLVVLPEGHKYYRVQNSLKTPGKSTFIHSTEGVAHFDDLPQGNWRIVSTLADLTEEQAQPLVFKAVTGRYRNYAHKDFKGNDVGTGILNALALNNKETALESFHSAIRAVTSDVLDPENTLILQKKIKHGEKMRNM